MFGENHAHIFMNARNYREAVRQQENGVDEEVIHRHFKAYQDKGISFVRDGGDFLHVSQKAKELSGSYGIDYRTPAFAIHHNGHYGKIVGRGFDTLKAVSYTHLDAYKRQVLLLTVFGAIVPRLL